jgi:hypothetical protein
MRHYFKTLVVFILFALCFPQKQAVAEDTPPNDETPDTAASTDEKPEAESTEPESEETAETEEAPRDNIPVFDLTDVGADEDRQTGENPEGGTTEEKQSQEAEEAPAVSEPVEQTKHPRMFALGISLFSEHGFGAAARLRFDHVAIDVAYGVQPIFFTYQKDDPETGDEKTKWEFDMALVNADAGVAVFFGDDQKGFQNGLRAQGIFNNIMGPGAGLGWVGDLCWKRFVLGFGAGVQAFFKYVDWVKDHFDYGSEVQISAFNAVQIYFGLNLMWYLV